MSCSGLLQAVDDDDDDEIRNPFVLHQKLGLLQRYGYTLIRNLMQNMNFRSPANELDNC